MTGPISEQIGTLIPRPDSLSECFLWLFLLVSIALAVLGALQPTMPFPAIDLAGSNTDLVYHLSAFALIAFLTGFLVRSMRAGVAWLIVGAVFLESLQILIPTRQFSLSDMAANIAGVLIGITLSFVLRYLILVAQRRD